MVTQNQSGKWKNIWEIYLNKSKTKMEDKEKFKEKNVDSYNELYKFLNKKGSKIRYIVTSNELAFFLTDEKDTNGYWIWNNKIMIPNPYQASNKLDFILKNDTVHSIRFSIHCICGIYENEEHNIFNKPK